MYDIVLVTSKGDVDCGPACLAMLLNYYGEPVTLDEMIAECGARIGGCTGMDLLRVGRAHGLDMTSYRMEAAELIRQDRPGICWWTYNHFVVFCGWDGSGNVVIANPGRGRFALDPESFGKLFSGVSFWNGIPETLPEDEEATAQDYEAALEQLGVSL